MKNIFKIFTLIVLLPLCNSLQATTLQQLKYLHDLIENDKINESIGYIQLHSINVNGKNAFGRTILWQAISKKSFPLVEFLIQNGADVNQFVDFIYPEHGWYILNQEAPIHIAADIGDIKIFKYLIQQGASPETLSHTGWTPLLKATGHGHEEIFTYLLPKVDVNYQDLTGDTSLSLAIWYDRLDFVKKLVRYGVLLPSRETIKKTYSRREKIQAYLLNVKDYFEKNILVTGDTRDENGASLDPETIPDYTILPGIIRDGPYQNKLFKDKRIQTLHTLHFLFCKNDGEEIL